jgi:hypothetical protein
MAGNVRSVNGREFLLKATRVWLPLAIAAGGVVAIILGHGKSSNVTAATGVALIIVALIVWMINWMFRMSVESNREREQEEEARVYFDVHGRWPDE